MAKGTNQQNTKNELAVEYAWARLAHILAEGTNPRGVSC